MKVIACSLLSTVLVARLLDGSGYHVHVCTFFSLPPVLPHHGRMTHPACMTPVMYPFLSVSILAASLCLRAGLLIFPSDYIFADPLIGN